MPTNPVAANYSALPKPIREALAIAAAQGVRDGNGVQGQDRGVMATARRKTTTEKGPAGATNRPPSDFRRRHRDGTPCDWCGARCTLDDTRNWDYDPDIRGSGHLQADHGAMTRSEAIRTGILIPLPDRLLHRRCNQQRGDGVNDHPP